MCSSRERVCTARSPFCICSSALITNYQWKMACKDSQLETLASIDNSLLLVCFSVLDGHLCGSSNKPHCWGHEGKVATIGDTNNAVWLCVATA